MRITHPHSPLQLLAVVPIKHLHGGQARPEDYFFVRLAIHLKRTELEPSGLLKTKMKLEGNKNGPKNE
jgi:hypothetical protein